MKRILFVFFIFLGVNPNGFTQSKPEVKINTGHAGGLHCFVFAQGGKYLLTGSGAGEIKLWDISSGKELKSYVGHTSKITSLSFAPDGKTFVSASWDFTVKIWDFQSGKVIHTLTGHKSYVNAASYSPDAKFIISCSDDKTIKKWDAEKGIFLNNEQISDKWNYYCVSYVTGQDIYLYGSSYDFLASSNQKSLQLNGGSISLIAVSPDGKTAAVHGSNKSFYMVDLASFTLIKEIVAHPKNGIDGLAISPDGKYVISAQKDLKTQCDTVKLWDASNGLLIKSFINLAAPIGFAPDGKYIIGQSKGSIRMIDYLSGQELKTFAQPSAAIRSLVFSPDGKTILAGTSDKSVKLWDVQTASLISTLTGHKNAVEEVIFSPDGLFALTSTKEVGDENNSIIIWDLNAAKIKYQLNNDCSFGFTFSPDGSIAIYNAGRSFKTVDLSTGKSAKIFDFYGFPFNVNYVSNSKQAFVSDGNDLFLVDIENRSKLKTYHNKSLVIEALLSPDGKFIAVQSFQLSVFNKESTELIWSQPLLNQLPRSIAFTKDGSQLITGHADNTIRVWDTFTGKELRTVTGHAGAITAIAISPDGKRMVSGAADNSIKLWDLSNFDLIYTMSANDDGSKWIVFNEDGYWDASPRGGELVRIVKDMEAYNIDQIAVTSNRPDLILKSAGSNNQELINHYSNLYKKRLKRLNLNQEQLSNEFHLPSAKIIGTKSNGKLIEISFSLSDDKYKLKRYNIFVNDFPMFGSYGKELNANKTDLTETIELVSGNNKIEVSCMNEKGMESYRAVTYANYDKMVEPDLYFLAFGVSEYLDKSLSLNYAHKDALDLESIMLDLKGRGYKNVFTKVLTNEQVTPEAIRAAKDFVKNAKTDDTFILFIAGHGKHDTDNEATYYFLTHNTDLNNLKGTAVDFETIEDLLQGIPPRNKLFLIDACESGEIDDEEQGHIIATAAGIELTSRGFKSVKPVIAIRQSAEKQSQTTGKRPYLYQKDRFIYNDLVRRSGAVVFSSSKGGELSYERSDFENGVFTEYIIKALTSNAADKDRNMQLSTEELRSYITEQVSKTTEGHQNPTIDRDNIFQKMDIKYMVNRTRENAMNIEMVRITGGTCQPIGLKKPANISDFLIGRYEVTQALWIEIMGTNPSI